MKNIIEKKSIISCIPIISVYPDNIKRCPIVFFIHGFMGKKEDGLKLGYRLAELGFYFVSLDADMQGERLDNRLVNALIPGETVFPHETGIDLFFLMNKSIVQTAKDIEFLIKSYSREEQVDIDRIGIAGGSFGANTAFYLTSVNPKVTVAVTMLGYPSFTGLWNGTLKNARQHQKWSDELETKAEQITRYIEDIDPFSRMNNFSPKPLLMINGERDAICPKQSSEMMYRYLSGFYSECSEQLKLSILDIGHEVTLEMEEQCCNWFERYL